MQTDFDWRDCVLIHYSNADFLRGRTSRIYDDVWVPFDVVHVAILTGIAFGFVMQFVLHTSPLLPVCSLAVGICGGIFQWRKSAKKVKGREASRLVWGQLLTATAESAENETTTITYRFTSLEGQATDHKMFTSEKAFRFSPGDKLVILLASDGSHVVL